MTPEEVDQLKVGDKVRLVNDALFYVEAVGYTYACLVGFRNTVSDIIHKRSSLWRYMTKV